MITRDIHYIGTNDDSIDLFEGQYVVPNGISYNSYVIMDEKIAVMDTVDKRKGEEYLKNLEKVLEGRTPDYLVLSHLEPDHGSSVQAFMEKYPDVTLVGNAKTFQMLPLFFQGEVKEKLTVKEGETLNLGQHTLSFIMAPMVHWPEVMMTYDSFDKVLFSADAFGKFGVGEDDQSILANLWAQIESVQDKLYSGLDSESLKELGDVELVNFSTPQVPAHMVTFMFTDGEKEQLSEILDMLADAAKKSSAVHLGTADFKLGKGNAEWALPEPGRQIYQQSDLAVPSEAEPRLSKLVLMFIH